MSYVCQLRARVLLAVPTADGRVLLVEISRVGHRLCQRVITLPARRPDIAQRRAIPV